jgi:hypothetical protein
MSDQERNGVVQDWLKDLVAMGLFLLWRNVTAHPMM